MLAEAARGARAAHVANATWSRQLGGPPRRVRPLQARDRQRQCLVRPTTTWQRAIEDIQRRFLPPDQQPGKMTGSDAHQPHEEILARSPFAHMHRGYLAASSLQRPSMPRDGLDFTTAIRGQLPFALRGDRAGCGHQRLSVDHAAAGGQNSSAEVVRRLCRVIGGSCCS